jgi:hypothetical protein
VGVLSLTLDFEIFLAFFAILLGFPLFMPFVSVVVFPSSR